MFKEKIVSLIGGVSGFSSILGSWQICHNLCLGLISLLSVIGISVAGMPFLFLTKIVIPLWTIALLLFGVTFYFYKKRKCVSKNLLLLNAGFLIAGIPFAFFEPYAIVLWTIGGAIAVMGIFNFVREKKPTILKKSLFFLFLLVFLVTLFVLRMNFFNSGSVATTGTMPLDLSKIVTGTTGFGDVEIAITPLTFKEGKLILELSANTHSVDLRSYGLQELTTLEINGKQIKPTMAPPLQGHHASGKLHFDIEKVESFTIKIVGIPAVGERIFTW